jgi:hypothetical protein
MSLISCPKCWEDICECGYEYEYESTAYLIKMRDLFIRLISERENNEKVAETSKKEIEQKIEDRPCIRV